MTALVDFFESKKAPENAKLGYKETPADRLPKSPKLEKYLITDDASPQVPKEVHESFRGYPWGMLGNDQYGDCGPVMILHGDEQSSLEVGIKPSPYLTAYAYQVYGLTAGWSPADPSSDVGTDWGQLLNYMETKGVGERKILGAADVNTDNLHLVDRAIWEFGCLYTGVQLPVTAQLQTIWDVDTSSSTEDQAPGSWGGHWIPVFSYDSNHFAFVSWGQVMLMTVKFFQKYCSLGQGGEGHVVIDPRMIAAKSGKTIHGFAVNDLIKDLGAA